MSDLEYEIEDTDFITIDTLSKEYLTVIVANPEYKVLLTELLNVREPPFGWYYLQSRHEWWH